MWWKAIAPGKTDNYFWKAIRSDFRDLAEEAGSLAARIEGMGYGDPDAMAAAMTELRAALGLGRVVSVPKRSLQS